MDQCNHCVCAGDLSWCLEEECNQHDSWFAKKQKEKIDVLLFALNFIASQKDKSGNWSVEIARNAIRDYRRI